MGTDIEVYDLGAARLGKNTGALLVQGKGPQLSADRNDCKSLDDAPVYSQIGVTAMHYPATDDGHAEGLFALNIPGSAGVMVGGRDTRTANIVGALKPGDTCVHSTGPNQAAQLQLKEQGRQAYLTAKTADGKDLVHVLDGSAEQIAISGFNYIVEMKKGSGVTIANGTGNASIQLLDDGTVWIKGSRVLLGSQPSGIVVTSVGASTGGVLA